MVGWEPTTGRPACAAGLPTFVKSSNFLLTEFPFAGKVVAQSLPTKGNPMDAAQLWEAVGKEVIARAEQCERGVIALRADGQAGIALVAPNSLLLAINLGLEDPFDFWLN